MNGSGSVALRQLLAQHENDLLTDWVSLQLRELGGSRRHVDERQLREQSREFLTAFIPALQRNDASTITGAEWSELRAVLDRITQARLTLGMTPSEVATFVFSLKHPI